MSETAKKTVTYADGETPVLPGDRVRCRVPFFRRLEGEVLYVPGVSPERDEMTLNGITNVGIRAHDVDRRGNVLSKPELYTLQVHPETWRLKMSVSLVRRGEPGTIGKVESIFADEA